MIAQAVVDEIVRLLAEEKLSQRQIARALRISRGTVGAIAAGKRPNYALLRHAADDESLEPAGPPERCPGCGGMVYMPCRLCRARNERAGRPPAPPVPAPPRAAPFALDLKEEHRKRYEQVRARRIQMEGLT